MTMKMTLGQLVEGALSEADQQLKLASAMDVRPPSGDSAIKIAMDGMDESGSDEDDKKKAKKKEEEEEEKTSALADASYAAQLCEALGHIGTMWSKHAAEMPTSAGQHNVGDNTQHSKTSPASVSAAEASHGGGGGGSEAVDGGSNTGIATNKGDYKNPEWKGNPEANRGAARTSGVHSGEQPAKTASLRKALVQQAVLLKEAGAKVAADPSSPQATGLGTSGDPGKLDFTPGNSTAVPDNSGMASMTKRQAKSQFVKGDTAAILAEPAFSGSTDKGLRDNLTMGLETAKISSIKTAAARTLLKRAASGSLGQVKQAAFQNALAHHRHQAG